MNQTASRLNELIRRARDDREALGELLEQHRAYSNLKSVPGTHNTTSFFVGLFQIRFDLRPTERLENIDERD